MFSAATAGLGVPRATLNCNHAEVGDLPQGTFMMRIRVHGIVIIMLAASSALFAQRNHSPVKAQDHSSVPDARQIMESSIAATQRQWQVRLHYTYMERDENRRLDTAGRVKSAEVDVSRTILVNGVPFEQLLERNGRPPSAEEERKQKEARQVAARNPRAASRAITQERRRRPRRSSWKCPRPSTSRLSAKK